MVATYVRPTIGEILVDPRYRQFAAVQLGRYRPAAIAGELPSAAAAPVGESGFLF